MYPLPASSYRYLPVGASVRLLFGLLLFVAALLAQEVQSLLWQAVALLCILCWQESGWRSAWRAMTFLPWLLVPLMLVHAMFTPGYVLWLGMTYEGVQQGIFLALRLWVLFFAALVLMRLLSMQEWMAYLRMFPRLFERVLPYVLLFFPLYQQSLSMMQSRVQAWRAERFRVASMGILILEMMQELMQQAAIVSEQLWSGWDDEVARVQQDGGASLSLSWQQYAYSMVLLSLGFVWVGVCL